MRVLGFGTYDVTRHPRAGTILAGLAAAGDDVLEINEPLGFTTAQRLAMLRAPWRATALAARMAARWTALVRRSRAARRDGGFDVVFVGYLGHFDIVLARLLFPRTRIVLDMMIFAADTARDRGVNGGLKVRLLGGLDRLAVRCADLVVVDTEESAELLSPSARPKAVVVPVGAADGWFAAGTEAKPSDDQTRVVFFGLYTPLQGSTVIGAALGRLAARPDIRITMIGSGQDVDPARRAAAANSAVQWIDWVEASELPHVVASHDVCLGIFGNTPKALRVVPNKVFQGAAAGCAVITSDTAPQRRILGDAACYVRVDDSVALADALCELADDPVLLSLQRALARAAALERFTASAIVSDLRARLAT